MWIVRGTQVQCQLTGEERGDAGSAVDVVVHTRIPTGRRIHYSLHGDKNIGHSTDTRLGEVTVQSVLPKSHSTQESNMTSRTISSRQTNIQWCLSIILGVTRHVQIHMECYFPHPPPRKIRVVLVLPAE